LDTLLPFGTLKTVWLTSETEKKSGAFRNLWGFVPDLPVSERRRWDPLHWVPWIRAWSHHWIVRRVAVGVIVRRPVGVIVPWVLKGRACQSADRGPG